MRPEENRRIGKRKDITIKPDYYKRKLSEEGRNAYEMLLKGLTDHQDIIVIPTKLPAEEADRTAYAVDFDNPQLYYVNFKDLRLQCLDEPGIPKCWGVYGAYYMSEEECTKLDRIMENEIREVLNEAAKEASFEGSCWKLYNWLLKRCSTGWCEEYRDHYPDAANSIIGPLILRETACEGYSKAFKFLFDKLIEKLPEKQGYECIVASEDGDDSSENSLGHAWNIIIKNNKEMLHCDLAYEPDEDERHGRYFMISEEELHRKRMIDSGEVSRNLKISEKTDCGVSEDVENTGISEDAMGCGNQVVINGNVYINGNINLNFNSLRVNVVKEHPIDVIDVEDVEVEECERT